MPASLARSPAPIQTLSVGGPSYQAPAAPPPEGAPEPSDSPPEAGGFPKLPGIQWEFKEQGAAVEAWHAPEGGRRNRAGKRYLGRFGKRRIAQLNALPANVRTLEIRDQVERMKAEKGIG